MLNKWLRQTRAAGSGGRIKPPIGLAQCRTQRVVEISIGEAALAAQRPAQ